MTHVLLVGRAFRVQGVTGLSPIFSLSGLGGAVALSGCGIWVQKISPSLSEFSPRKMNLQDINPMAAHMDFSVRMPSAHFFLIWSLRKWRYPDRRVTVDRR